MYQLTYNRGKISCLLVSRKKVAQTLCHAEGERGREKGSENKLVLPIRLEDSKYIVKKILKLKFRVNHKGNVKKSIRRRSILKHYPRLNCTVSTVNIPVELS